MGDSLSLIDRGILLSVQDHQEVNAQVESAYQTTASLDDGAYVLRPPINDVSGRRMEKGNCILGYEHIGIEGA